MLKLRRTLGWAVTFVALGALGLIGITTPAHAEPEVPEGCWKEESTNDMGEVQVIVMCPEGVGNNPGAGGGDDGGGNAEPIGDRECTYADVIKVECETSAGIWDGTCYVKVADPQPDTDHPVWAGHEDEDGVIIQCTAYNASGAEECDADGGCPAGVSLRWAAGPPDEGPSPDELARRAVAAMQLTMGEIGSTPPPVTTAADSLGAVGTPIWFWVANPGPNTTGPLTETASDGGLTVTATATLQATEWTLANEQGATIATTTCSGENAAGTPYDERGIVPSPTCGIPAAQNQQIGTLTVTGTAHWTVEWSGGGHSGTIPVPGQSTSAPIEIGEIQTIITNQ